MLSSVQPPGRGGKLMFMIESAFRRDGPSLTNYDIKSNKFGGARFCVHSSSTPWGVPEYIDIFGFSSVVSHKIIRVLQFLIRAVCRYYTLFTRIASKYLWSRWIICRLTINLSACRASVPKNVNTSINTTILYYYYGDDVLYHKKKQIFKLTCLTFNHLKSRTPCWC